MKIYDINTIERNDKKVFIVELDEHEDIFGVTFVATVDNVLTKVTTTNHKGEKKTYKRITKEFKNLYKEVVMDYLISKYN